MAWWETKWKPSVLVSSLVHGPFHGCGLLGSQELWDCWNRRELTGHARVCIRVGEEGWLHSLVTQVLAVLVMVAARWARQVRGGEDTVPGEQSCWTPGLSFQGAEHPG